MRRQMSPVREVLKLARYAMSRLPNGPSAFISAKTVVLKSLFCGGLDQWLDLPDREAIKMLMSLPAWMLYLVVMLPDLLSDVTSARERIDNIVSTERRRFEEKARSLISDLATMRDKVDEAEKRVLFERNQARAMRAAALLAGADLVRESRKSNVIGRVFWPATAYATV